MAVEPRDTIELTDPRALRALAHPTRLKLVALLRREGPMTATGAGERIGESPASCSYHLRQLATWGLVEEAGGGRGRERPWRATARSTSWQVTRPEAAEPSAALSAMIARHQMEELLRAIDRLPAEPLVWQKAQQLTDTQLLLTPDQLEGLGRRFVELLDAYRTEPSAPPAAGAPLEGAGTGPAATEPAAAEPAATEPAAAEGAAGGPAAARKVGIFFAAYALPEEAS